MAARGADDQHRKGRRGRRPETGGVPGRRPGGPGRPAPVPVGRRRRRGAGGSVLAALGSLLALAVLLAGVPALLGYGTLTVAATGDPIHGDLLAALTSPDDGSLFLWLLVGVGWIGWLCFLLSVLIEIPAQLRGRVARRLPAFGWSQRIAAGLVGSVLALLPVAGSAFAATPELPQRPSAVAQLASSPALAALPAAAPSGALTADPQQPVYTVRDARPADSLWSIAERQLGSGERWTEIAKLNAGRPMDDSGARFDADRPIQPGWRLLMPADAKPDAGSGSGAAAQNRTTPPALPAGPGGPVAPAHSTVTVHSGDSLSAIAQRELGDGDRWPELFDANKGVTAPDGERLTDPDVLAPGMVLTVPGATQPPAPAPQTEPPASEPPTGQSPAPDTAQSPAPSTAPATEPPAPQTPAPTAPAAETPAPQQSAPAANLPAVRDRQDAGTGDDYTVPLAASTLGVLMAAALITLVARRRTDQQRARRPRHRIALPSAAAGHFEAELKARQNEGGLELLNRALRTLGRNTVRGDKRLPALVAARITTAGTVELHLAAPAVPIAPFRAAHAPNVWWCPEDSTELLSAGQAAKYAAPYPALVTLGNTPDGATVLADLETVRLVHLSGHPDDADDVLRTLAVELAHSPLADRLHLHLVGVAADLPAAGPATDRVHHHATLEAALAALGPRTAKARATLVAAEADNPREARSRGSADEAWVPEIVLSAQPPAGNLPAELGRLLDGRPRTCLAVLTRAPERGAGPVARWTLPATGPAVLPGLHLTVELQRLSREQYDQLGELVRASGDFTQQPAPEWTLDGPHNGPEDEAELPLPVPALAAVGAAIGAGPAPFGGGFAPDGESERADGPIDARLLALLGGPTATGAPSTAPDVASTTVPAKHTGEPAGGDAAGPRLLARVVPSGSSPFAGLVPTAPTNPYAVAPVTPVQAPALPPTAPPPAEPRPRHAANGQARQVTTPPHGTPVDPRLSAHAAPAPAAEPAPADGTRSFELQAPAPEPAPPAPTDGTRSFELLPPAAVDLPAAAPAAVDLPAAAPAPADLPAAAPAPADLPAAPPAVPAQLPPAAPATPEPLPTHDQAAAPDPRSAAVAARPSARPGSGPARTDSDDLLAILRSPEAHHLRSAPRIRVLGPVDVLGAAGSTDPAGRPRLTELAAYLALRPGSEHTTVDRDIHPGAAHLDPRATAERLAEPLPAKLAALAGWLGASPEGRDYLSAQAAETYTLAPTVSCDWDEFRSLYRRGMRSTSTTADAALAHALALVRGAPFAEAAPGSFGWAETERQDMLAAIVDTAHELAARRLQYGDHRTAEAAIFRALAVAPEVELLHRDLFYAYASAGARDQLVRAVNRLDALSRRTGRDLDPDTLALLRDLLTGA
ncbi:LysM peptidoglycan-binding domain-containing protein [Streptomyces sp. TLI_171]|uniref:LysM peptidoglycan-binding domain-containing protein n=1 Tax=Streptomyces sp. TLI_171 TaxID=1938859 RepID=UPI000C19212F|nr:LysM peptidoglycan-binding domain-containing protein [Streptomyces sp. TLI_171]RKE22589.1 DNA-binding SARP family transcriptional activator [Streptomyces sp. TLI_171]